MTKCAQLLLSTGECEPFAITSLGAFVQLYSPGYGPLQLLSRVIGLHQMFTFPQISSQCLTGEYTKGPRCPLGNCDRQDGWCSGVGLRFQKTVYRARVESFGWKGRFLMNLKPWIRIEVWRERIFLLGCRPEKLQQLLQATCICCCTKLPKDCWSTPTVFAKYLPPPTFDNARG